MQRPVPNCAPPFRPGVEHDALCNRRGADALAVRRQHGRDPSPAAGPDAPLSLGADGRLERALRLRPWPAAGTADAWPRRGCLARDGARVPAMAGAGVDVREQGRTDLQHDPRHRSRRQCGRPLPQDVPVRTARGGCDAGRRVLRLRGAWRRQVRGAQLLRHLVSGDDAHGHRHGRRGDPAPGDDPHHRPRRRPERGQGQCRHVPELRLRHQRPRRWRQRHVLRARPVGSGHPSVWHGRGDHPDRDRPRAGASPAGAGHAHAGPAAEELQGQQGAVSDLRSRQAGRAGLSRLRSGPLEKPRRVDEPAEPLAAE